jgi:hypothetical protein
MSYNKRVVSFLSHLVTELLLFDAFFCIFPLRKGVQTNVIITDILTVTKEMRSFSK